MLGKIVMLYNEGFTIEQVYLILPFQKKKTIHLHVCIKNLV